MLGATCALAARQGVVALNRIATVR